MRWRGRQKSNNVEDRRNVRITGYSGSGRGGGLLHLLPMVVRFLGFKGTVILVLGLLAFGLFSGNLGNMLSILGLQQTAPTSTQTVPLQQTREEKEQVEFVSVVLADTEETWTALFREKGLSYQEPRLVLFRDAVASACGMAQSAVGPFYCPADGQVYLDLDFFDQLAHRFQAPGDFAQAYVIAHEVGHHVQNLLGISEQVQSASRRLSRTEANRLSVMQELQADCLAGVWAHHAQRLRQLLEAGDIEEGLSAASAIGDDTLQRQTRGYVSPDSFTHGTSAQRVQWFRTGLESGSMDSCNTFNRD